MTPRETSRKSLSVLLVEADVLVRFALAEHLRACDILVIEAVSADDAKSILVAGPSVDLLLSDAQLAGEGSGFVLAQWVRSYRPGVETVLTGSIAGKVQAVVDIAARVPECAPGSDAATLTAKLNAMLAERKRRSRQQSKSAPVKRRTRRA
jgi:DNA-binding NtrC family response regulator